MGYNFPNAPIAGQVYLGYKWDGEKWTSTSAPITALPDAPTDGLIYARKNAAWARAVALAGDTMTGALVLSGDPTAPLQAVTKQYADAGIAGTVSKAYVDAQDALAAPINSPVFTGNPTAPTQAAGDNDTSIATTAFVQFATGKYLPLAGGTVTGGLQVNGQIIVASGGAWIYGWQNLPAQGVLFLGNTGNRYLVYDGNVYTFVGAAVNAINGRLWGSGDFGGVPFTDARWAMAGDYFVGAGSTFIEPWVGGVVCASGGNYNRYRYLQVSTTSWWTVGYYG